MGSAALRRIFHCIPDAIGGVANGLGRSHNSVGFACLILIVDEQDISGDSKDRDKDDGENYTPAASPAFNDGGGGSLSHPFRSEESRVGKGGVSTCSSRW